MNNFNDQTTVPREQIILAEPSSLSTVTVLPTPELEIRFGDLPEEEQAMVGKSLKHHLAIALANEKFEHADQVMGRFSVFISGLYIEVEYQLSMLELRAKGHPREERITNFLARRGQRYATFLERAEELLATRLLIEAGKSVYPKPKLNHGKGSLFNIRILTSETTTIKEAEQDKDLPPPVASGTFFGSGID